MPGKRTWVLAAAALASAALGAAAPPPTISLTRLACGDDPAPEDVSTFSDSFAYPHTQLRLTYSCYLIRHGDEYLLWDTGNPPGQPESGKASLLELLRALRLRPEQITYVGISHYHTDHTGQLKDFLAATLLIGAGDWRALQGAGAPADFSAADAQLWRAPFVHWLREGGRLKTPEGDLDVFGDATVVMLATPGHTPGHHSLLVRLPRTGAVLLSGDLAHFAASYDHDQVPLWNTSRSETLASLDRFKQIAHNLQARVILQHDPGDIDKLPPFPQAAE